MKWAMLIVSIKSITIRFNGNDDDDVTDHEIIILEAPETNV